MSRLRLNARPSFFGGEKKKNPPTTHMACFWRGLIECLTPHERQHIFKGATTSPERFVQWLVSRNTSTHGITVNGAALSAKEIEENIEAVRSYDGRVHAGYLCSTSDPFLLLFAFVMRVTIEHQFMGHTIRYFHPHASRTVRIASNSGHLWFAGTTPPKPRGIAAPPHRAESR